MHFKAKTKKKEESEMIDNNYNDGPDLDFIVFTYLFDKIVLNFPSISSLSSIYPFLILFFPYLTLHSPLTFPLLLTFLPYLIIFFSLFHLLHLPLPSPYLALLPFQSDFFHRLYFRVTKKR